MENTEPVDHTDDDGVFTPDDLTFAATAVVAVVGLTLTARMTRVLVAAARDPEWFTNPWGVYDRLRQRLQHVTRVPPPKKLHATNSFRDQYRVVWVDALDTATETMLTAFRKEIDQIRRETRGVTPSKKSVDDAVARLKSQHVTAFTDKSGRRWPLHHYLRTAARTALARERMAQQLTRWGRDGVTHVVVTGPRGSCDRCAPWVGVTVPVGFVSRLKSMGLFHPNCRHGLRAVVGGVRGR